MDLLGTYDFAGSDQYFTFPEGTEFIELRMRGPGGPGGAGTASYAGGGGGSGVLSFWNLTGALGGKTVRLITPYGFAGGTYPGGRGSTAANHTKLIFDNDLEIQAGCGEAGWPATTSAHGKGGHGGNSATTTVDQGGSHTWPTWLTGISQTNAGSQVGEHGLVGGRGGNDGDAGGGGNGGQPGNAGSAAVAGYIQLICYGTPVNDPTKLLLYFGTAFEDSSPYERTVTAHGTCRVSSGAMIVDGAGYTDIGWLDGGTIADFSGDFTWEFKFKAYTQSGFRGLAAVGDAYHPFLIGRDGTDLKFWSSSNGTSFDIANGVSMGTLSTSNFVHIAAVRDGTDLRLYNDGVLINTITGFTASGVQPFYMGGQKNNWQSMGEFKMVRFRTEAMYDSNFTPAVSAYS